MVLRCLGGILSMLRLHLLACTIQDTKSSAEPLIPFWHQAHACSVGCASTRLGPVCASMAS